MRGAIVLGGAQSVKIATQLGSVIILSRLLQPADFGVAAATAPIIAFMSIFQDLGFQQGVIQKASISEADLTRIFWLTLTLGIGLAAVMAALSPVAAWFFHDARLLEVTAVAGLPLLGYSVAVVPSALLNRHGRFGAIAMIESIVACIGLGTALVGALCGLRYWALVLSSIAASLAGAALSILMARWVPGRPVLAWPDRGLVHFAKNLTGFSVLNFFGQNADNMLIGHAWGGIELGLYDRAFKLLLLPIQSLSGPMYRIMIPLMSRIETDKIRLRRVYVRATSQFLLIVMPGMATLVATAPDFIHLVFGPRWDAVTPIFFWLGLVGFNTPLGHTSAWLYISQAKTQAMFRVSVVTSSTKVVAFLVGLHWGGTGVAMAYAISDFVFRLPFSYWCMTRIGPVTVGDLASLQIPLMVAAGATWVVSHSVLGGWAGLSGFPLIVATGVASYGIAMIAMATMTTGRDALGEVYGSIVKLVGVAA